MTASRSVERSTGGCGRACLQRCTLALLIINFVLLGGCHSPAGLRVSVRDSLTHEPVSGAVLVVRSLNLFVPGGGGGFVNPFRTESVRAETDAAGTARLGTVPIPGSLLILSEDFEPVSVLLEEAAPRDAGSWIPVASEPSAATQAQLEIRLQRLDGEE